MERSDQNLARMNVVLGLPAVKIESQQIHQRDQSQNQSKWRFKVETSFIQISMISNHVNRCISTPPVIQIDPPLAFEQSQPIQVRQEVSPNSIKLEKLLHRQPINEAQLLADFKNRKDILDKSLIRDMRRFLRRKFLVYSNNQKSSLFQPLLEDFLAKNPQIRFQSTFNSCESLFIVGMLIDNKSFHSIRLNLNIQDQSLKAQLALKGRIILDCLKKTTKKKIIKVLKIPFFIHLMKVYREETQNDSTYLCSHPLYLQEINHLLS